MTHIHLNTITKLLQDIEVELRHLELWQCTRPSAEALASTQPFCIDTLSLPEWIQFVLLERLQAMLDAAAPLPTRCGVAPLAEEHFKGVAEDGAQLIELLVRLDQALSESHSGVR